MAPRPPETFAAFVARLEHSLESGSTQVRFGTHHHSHAVCLEEGRLRVRRLEYSREQAAAYLREHGAFMPEHAEAISEPGSLVLDEPDLASLIAALEPRWPM